jgi:mannose-1-phosphate guanylyltransferase
MTSPPNVFAVIMAGGVGARFWPRSRKQSPKQLLALGPTSEALLAATVRRLGSIAPAERTLIVTGESLAKATAAASPTIPAQNILAEPVGRNTAPCVAWAALHVEARSPGSVMAVLPADHHIGDEKAYAAVLKTAVEAAQGGALVTVGLRPTRPETGYGYIELASSASASSTGAEPVTRFVEKPNAEKAEEFIATGRFLWNSGMFFFRSDVILREVEKHLPKLHGQMQQLCAAMKDGTEAASVREVYPALESVSIDYGVMERADNVLVVPGDFGWSDLGSWTTAWELAPKDPEGNALPPESVAVDSRNNFALTSAGKMVALVGVDDLVIVDTPDALLVMPRSRAQEVRKIVDELTKRNDGRL